MRLTAAPAVAGVVLTGCPSSPGAATTTHPTPAPRTHRRPPPQPTESAAPSVAPADGKGLATDTFTAKAPRGWSTRRGGTSLAVQVFAFSPDELTFVAIADGPAVNDDSIDERAQEVARSGEFERAPTVMKPVTIDGVEAYHVAGDVGNGSYIIEVGTIHGRTGPEPAARDLQRLARGVAADPRLGPGELAVVLTRTAARQLVILAAVAGLALGCGGNDSPDPGDADPPTTSAAPSPDGLTQPERAAGDRRTASRVHVHGASPLEAGRSSAAAAARSSPPSTPPTSAADGNVTGLPEHRRRVRVRVRPAGPPREAARPAPASTRSRRRSWGPSTSTASRCTHVAGAVGHGNHVIDLGAIVG